MPKRVDEVRLRIDRVRLKDGVSAPPSRPGMTLGSRRFGLEYSGVGLGGEESSGEGLMRFRSKGRRGTGRSRGGPSVDMLQKGNNFVL